MFSGPIRGGTRGGAGDFKWSDVAGDEKHRENYLGHSLNAPVGRWQKGKDLQWFSRDKGSSGDQQADEDAKKEELRRIKEAEEDALAVALGFKPTPRNPSQPEATSSNAAPLGPARSDSDPDAAAKKAEEKAARKAERAAKRAEKEKKRAERDQAKDGARRSKGRDRERSRSRSLGDREPKRGREHGDRGRRYGRSRSRSPRRRDHSRDRARYERDRSRERFPRAERARHEAEPRRWHDDEDSPGRR